MPVQPDIPNGKFAIFHEMEEWRSKAEELAAKVRGYFTNSKTGRADIPECLDGDWDLYNLASQLTTKVMQPGCSSAKEEQ